MRRILIVEDEPNLREAYTTLFKLQKYEVHEAANGKEALAILKKRKLNVLLLDLLMPVMGGIEFLKKADVTKNYPQTKVLVLSNISDSKTIHQVQKLGAYQYMLKASISPGQLVKLVESLE